MKGKNTFTSAQADNIRKLIRKKLVADAKEQKRIRDEIRALGLYITDFTNKKRYTTDDFDENIKIVG